VSGSAAGSGSGLFTGLIAGGPAMPAGRVTDNITAIQRIRQPGDQLDLTAFIGLLGA
jgi:hypothetical protein